MFTSNGERSDTNSQQYQHLGIIGKALRGYLEKLKAAELIEVQPGIYNPKLNQGYSTKVRAKSNLIEFLRDEDISLDKVRHRRMNPVIWRDEEKQTHSVESEIEIKAGSEVLEQYSRLLQLSDIRVGNDPLCPFEKNIRRIFRDKDCTLDGRHSGGIWQTLPSEARAKIRINGLDVIEIDIKATHPTIAYALINKDLTMMALEGFDPYQLKELSHFKDKKAVRELIKTITLMMFNSTKLSVKQSAQSEINKSPTLLNIWKELKDNGFGIDTIVELLLKKHMYIRKFFFSKAWKQFNFYESNVAQRVIEHFTNKGIVVLTVFDSFIVQREYKDELKQTLAKALVDELTTYFVSKDRLSTLKSDNSISDTEAEAELLKVRIYRDSFNE